jgi:hypothetical protein
MRLAGIAAGGRDTFPMMGTFDDARDFRGSPAKERSEAT